GDRNGGRPGVGRRARGGSTVAGSVAGGCAVARGGLGGPGRGPVAGRGGRLRRLSRAVAGVAAVLPLGRGAVRPGRDGGGPRGGGGCSARRATAAGAPCRGAFRGTASRPWPRRPGRRIVLGQGLTHDAPRIVLTRIKGGQVVELRAELFAHLLARSHGDPLDLAGHPSELLGELGETFRPDEEERKDGEDDQLTTVDPEHALQDTGTRAPTGAGSVAHFLVEDHSDLLDAVPAPHPEHDLVPRRRGADCVDERVGFGDRLAVDAHDHLAGLDPGLVPRAAWRDGRRPTRFVLEDLDALAGVPRVQGDADDGVGGATVLDDLVSGA